MGVGVPRPGDFAQVPPLLPTASPRVQSNSGGIIPGAQAAAGGGGERGTAGGKVEREGREDGCATAGGGRVGARLVLRCRNRPLPPDRPLFLGGWLLLPRFPPPGVVLRKQTRGREEGRVAEDGGRNGCRRQAGGPLERVRRFARPPGVLVLRGARRPRNLVRRAERESRQQLRREGVGRDSLPASRAPVCGLVRPQRRASAGVLCSGRRGRAGSSQGVFRPSLLPVLTGSCIR